MGSLVPVSFSLSVDVLLPRACSGSSPVASFRDLTGNDWCRWRMRCDDNMLDQPSSARFSVSAFQRRSKRSGQPLPDHVIVEADDPSFFT